MWHTSNPKRSKKVLDLSITMEGQHRAVRKEQRNKAPVPDGICREIYKNLWNINKRELLNIINIMYLEDLVSEAQKHGHIICLPKIVFLAHLKKTDLSRS